MLGKPRIRLNNLETCLRFPCLGLDPIIDSINLIYHKTFSNERRVGEADASECLDNAYTRRSDCTKNTLSSTFCCHISLFLSATFKIIIKWETSIKCPTLRLSFTVSHFCTGAKMLIFGGMLVSWALNFFCLLIYKKLTLPSSQHASGK